jgi:predicted dehydrogenase
MGAAALARPAFSQATGAPIGVGMIGVGNRGSADMKDAMADAGVKLTALCDIKPDRLDKAASVAAAHKPATTKDYRELLERKDVDAVIIATPCDLHVEMAIAAIKAGKHVYCEKPAGTTPESIQRLVTAVRASDRVFQIGQQMRSMARLRKTIERSTKG